MLKQFSVTSLCLFLFVSFSGAAMLHVPAEYATIDEGIDAAEAGDTVLIDPGVYNEEINFNGKTITVASLFLMTGDDSYIDNTIISNTTAEGECTNHTVTFNSGENSQSILSGLAIIDMPVIIEDESYPTISSLHITGTETECDHSSLDIRVPSSFTVDGIIFINSDILSHYLNQHLTFSNCTFIATDIIRLPENSSAVFTNNEFVNCTLTSGGTGYDSDSLVITDNLFTDSRIHLGGTGHITITADIRRNEFVNASDDGSTISCSGTGELEVFAVIDSNSFEMAGIDLGGTGDAKINTVITNNIFSGSGDDMQGVMCGGTGNCVVTATIDTNRFYGAGFTISGTGEFLVNASLSRNIFTGSSGSAILLDRISLANYTVNLIHNTIADNGTGVFYDNVGGLNIQSCIIWGNGTDLVNVNEEQITYSLWATGIDPCGSTNVFGDPLIADIENRDFSLLAGSPCIDQGAPSPYPDPDGTPPDIGAIPFYQTTATLPGIALLENRSTTPILQGSLLYTGQSRSPNNTYMIFDIKGKLLHRGTIRPGAQAVDLSALPLSAGSYIIRCTNDGKLASLRYIRR